MLQQTNYDHLVLLAGAVVVLVLVILALVATWRSDVLETGSKVVWSIVVIAFPLIGLALWGIAWAVRSQRAAAQSRD